MKNILPHIHSYILLNIDVFIYSLQNLKGMAKKNPNLKRDRFKNVAGRRVQKILDSVDSLAKCANRNNYDYEDEDVSKMLRAIKEKIKALEASYTSNTKSTKNTFEF